jgi:thioredoxin 1
MNKLLVIVFAFLLVSSCKKDEVVETPGLSTDLKNVSSLVEYENGIKSGVSLMFFHATWCSICKAQRPAVENVVKEVELKAVNFGQVDTDKNNDILNKYDIQGQPIIVIYKDGVEKNRLAGSGHSQQKISEILKALL